MYVQPQAMKMSMIYDFTLDPRGFSLSISIKGLIEWAKRFHGVSVHRESMGSSGIALGFLESFWLKNTSIYREKRVPMASHRGPWSCASRASKVSHSSSQLGRLKNAMITV